MPKRGENIHKRKDGRWEGRYICGRRADGKAIYRSVYSRSYYETRDKLNEAKSDLIAEQKKTVVSNKNISEEKTTEKYKGNDIFFYTVCTAWLEMKQKTVRPSTLQKYRLLCEKHIIPELGGIKCSKISTEVLNRFMNVITEKKCTVHHKTGEKFSDSYMTAIFSALNAILKYGSENGYIERLPPLSYKCKPAVRDRVFSAQEQQRLIRCVMREPDNLNLGILVCLYTGLRIGEICALKWDDIDTEQGMIIIRKTLQRISNSSFDNDIQSDIGGQKTRIHISDPKSESSKRIIPIPDFLCNIIKTHLTKKPGAFFLSGSRKPVEPKTYREHYKKYLKEAGLDYINFHSLRHTFATQCINSGFDVKMLSEILGHSNVSVTMNRYVHPTFEMKKTKMDRLPFEYTDLYYPNNIYVTNSGQINGQLT